MKRKKSVVLPKSQSRNDKANIEKNGIVENQVQHFGCSSSYLGNKFGFLAPSDEGNERIDSYR